MKQIKIPFSLSEYNKGGYRLETREGNSARILCSDLMGENDRTIVIAVKKNYREYLCSLYKNGRYSVDKKIDNDNDIFLVKIAKRDLKDCKLKPFDKVLVKFESSTPWQCNIFSRIAYISGRYRFQCIEGSYVQCIPYNSGTKYLLGTCEEAPDNYKIW